MIADLEALGERPRIQDAYRSPAAQAAAVASGNSSVGWSFHNARNPDGTPGALAVDLLDENYPVPGKQIVWPVSFRRYLVRLAHCAGRHELETLCYWTLGTDERKALAFAVEHLTDYTGKFGKDPTHVEPAGLTLAAARHGYRPW